MRSRSLRSTDDCPACRGYGTRHFNDCSWAVWSVDADTIDRNALRSKEKKDRSDAIKRRNRKRLRRIWIDKLFTTPHWQSIGALVGVISVILALLPLLK